MIQDRLNDKDKEIKGVRKQSAELLSIAWQKGYIAGFDDGYATRKETERPQNCFTRQDLQDWLYQIMFNNIGTNFELACEELISRLDGFEKFVEDRRKEGR